MKYDINQLSLDEKLRLLTGKTYWTTDDLDGKVREIFVADGPHGLRKVIDGKKYASTVMPNLSQIANSWDRESAYLSGETIANDCIENSVDVLLAPGVNLKRTPLCGRNFEYFSEDPLLAGELASAYINGVQSKGVGTSIKHFCVNNLEVERFFQSSEVGERTMRELYIRPFEIAIEKAKPWTVMCSYNLINGVLSSENKWILNDILREDLGHKGLIVSDWRAVKNPYKAVKATLDLEMPHDPESFAILKDAYERGLINDKEIDFCVTNIINLMQKCDDAKQKRTINYTKEQRHENAVKIASEGIVLLKNNGALPLVKGKVMVTGMPAQDPPIGGGGSANAITDYPPVNLADMLKKEKSCAEFEYEYVQRLNGSSVFSQRAYTKAYEYDAVVVCVKGYPESESSDRESIKLPVLEEDFILNLARVNHNVVVCVYAGSAIDMSAWIDKVNAVVFVGYAGEGVHQALAPILTGRICPSGKLSETFPLCLEDTPSGALKSNGFYTHYSEGLFIGYRYYEQYEKPVLFPFGFGLSYVNFTYSDLQIEKKGQTDYSVSYSITNNSTIDAKEISQLYVKDVFSQVVRPIKELKGFSKDLIKAGQTVRVSIDLDKRAFAYYCLPLKTWYVENGTFEILVGASSQDIKLVGKIKIELPETEQTSIERVKSIFERKKVNYL